MSSPISSLNHGCSGSVSSKLKIAWLFLSPSQITVFTSPDDWLMVSIVSDDWFMVSMVSLLK